MPMWVIIAHTNHDWHLILVDCQSRLKRLIVCTQSRKRVRNSKHTRNVFTFVVKLDFFYFLHVPNCDLAKSPPSKGGNSNSDRNTPSRKACVKAAPANFRKLPCKSNDLLRDFSKGDKPFGKGVVVAESAHVVDRVVGWTADEKASAS